MGWEVAVLGADGLDAGLGGHGAGTDGLGTGTDGLAFETGPWTPAWPAAPEPPQAEAAQVESGLRDGGAAVIDVDSSRRFEAGHVPGAAWALRTDLGEPGLADRLGRPDRLVLTSVDGMLARFAAADVPAGIEVVVLAGGTAGWARSGRPLERGPAAMLSPVIDVYRRPYEGTGVAPDAMQTYLDWEYGLVGQLDRDGTHGFRVLR
jgi:rhodanese-related sulfurtransferase